MNRRGFLRSIGSVAALAAIPASVAATEFVAPPQFEIGMTLVIDNHCYRVIEIERASSEIKITCVGTNIAACGERKV